MAGNREALAGMGGRSEHNLAGNWTGCALCAEVSAVDQIIARAPGRAARMTGPGDPDGAREDPDRSEKHGCY